MVYNELNLTHRPGDLVCWSTIGGKQFRGILKEWDSNVAIVLCDDGITRSVEGKY